MGLTILLITLIVLAILLVVFLGIQAKKITNAYLDSINYHDIEANKPTFIRINDDENNDYIINTNDIKCITKKDIKNKIANTECFEYIFQILIWYGENENCYTLSYDDIQDREKIYLNLADYTINYE